MGCNCKKPQVLNYTNSPDHLKLMFKVYEDVIQPLPLQEYTEVEHQRVLNVYKAIYPNVKVDPTTEHIIKELTELYKQKKK